MPDAGTPDPQRLFVLLVEPDGRMRQTTTEHLERGGYEVLAASTIAEARTRLDRTPDLHAAIVEAELPDGAGSDLIRLLLDRRPLCRSLVSANGTSPELGAISARAGAHVYLRKPHALPELLDAVSRTVHSTLEWRHALNPAHANQGRAWVLDDAPLPVSFDVQRAMARLRFVANLSPAETMTAWRLLWGDSNKRMSELMGCTERTVKFHVAEVLARTGARSRAGLLRVLLEDAGLRDPWDGRGSFADDSDPDRG